MKLFEPQRPRRHRNPRDREKRFDFHRDLPKGKSASDVKVLVILLVLLLALWKIFN